MDETIKFVRHFKKIPTKSQFRLLRITCELIDELQENQK